MKCCDLPTMLILGLLGALLAVAIGWRVLDAGERERVRTARLHCTQIAGLVRQYSKEYRGPLRKGAAGVEQVLAHFEPLRFPANRDAYLGPWGRPYRIEKQKLGNGSTAICVLNYGADGRPGGSGFAEDIVQPIGTSD